MKNKKNIILSFALLIAIIFSFVVFLGFGTTEKSSIEICSFIFILLTEIIIFGNVYIILNKKLNTFSIAGLSSTTFLYTICSLITNVIVSNLFLNLRSLLIFNICAILIHLFINTIIMLFKEGK